MLTGLQFLALGVQADPTSDKGWQRLFNGNNLDGWTAKFKGYPAGTNYKNTFRVEDNLLTVSYQHWENFDNETFGHLFTDKSYSHYRLRVQYRFIGKQVTQDKTYAWAYRNNGLMLHAQSPKSMAINQLFPISAEAQLLGGDGKHPRSTANLCSPSTNIIKNSHLIRQHCIPSSSKTFHGDQWVWFEAEVSRAGPIKHWVNGDLVFEYDALHIDATDPWGKQWLQNGGPVSLTEGHIAIQAETHPIQFRRIDIKPIH